MAADLTKKRAAVVGAGIGGLSAAAQLAHAGWEVDLYEAQSYAGGKAGSRTVGDYRFDTGPSLFTMPWVFRDYFSSLGLNMEKYLRPIPLEPICNYFYTDGTRLSAYQDEARFGQEIEAHTASRSEELSAYLQAGRKLWNRAGKLFLFNSLHEAATYLNPRAWPSMLSLPAIDAFRSLHDANQAFFRDPHLVQLFDRYATYNGSDPYKTPATMRIVPHVEYQWGGYMVEGGIVSIPRALEAAAREMGVRIHLNSPVERILLDSQGNPQGAGQVRGIRVHGTDVAYPVVVSNADVLSTYRKLLGTPDAPEAKRYERLEPSSSALVFLWGVGAQFPELSTNNIFFSSDYRKEFRNIFEEHTIPEEPTIYVNITSKCNPQDAPNTPGRRGENWFVLVNTPPHRGQDWDALARLVKERVLSRLSRELGRDIRPLIEAEGVITPQDIERDTGSTYGSLYGIASNERFAAFLRHPNRSRRIRGLYFTGGSAHPGGGMPLALLSGTIAAQLALRYTK
jgi:phytoene desaturase